MKKLTTIAYMLFIQLSVVSGLLTILPVQALEPALLSAPAGASQSAAATATPAASPTVLPIVSPGVPHEQARKNALIFILAMTVLLGGLVAVGYWKQKSEGKTPEMAWVVALTLALLAVNVAVLSNPVHTNAFCPVCTVAIGAGLGIAKSLGIDDVITSVWIGGLMVSMTMWLINWLDKKHIRFLFRKPLVVLVMYGLVIIPFMISHTIGSTGNTLWGMDKIVLGMIFGTIAFGGGYIIDKLIIKKNNGQVYFPFQKVVVPIAMMILFSLAFYFIVY